MSERDNRVEAKRVRLDAAEKLAAENASEGRVMADYGNSFRRIEDHLERSNAAQAEVGVLKNEVKEEMRQKLSLEVKLRAVQRTLEGAVLREAQGAERFRLLEVRAVEAEERVRSLEVEAKKKSALLQEREESLRISQSALGDSLALTVENNGKLKLLEARVNKATTVCRERSFDEVTTRFAEDLFRMMIAEQRKEPSSFKSIISYSHKDFKEGHEKVIKG